MNDYNYFHNKIKEIHDQKNADYGNSFEQNYNKFGFVACLIPILNKVNRLEVLAKNKAQVKEESIEDTLLDLANYCLLSAEVLSKKNGVE